MTALLHLGVSGSCAIEPECTKVVPWSDTPKGNAAIINVIIYTCGFPAMTIQNDVKKEEGVRSSERKIIPLYLRE